MWMESSVSRDYDTRYSRKVDRNEASVRPLCGCQESGQDISGSVLHLLVKHTTLLHNGESDTYQGRAGYERLDLASYHECHSPFLGRGYFREVLLVQHTTFT